MAPHVRNPAAKDHTRRCEFLRRVLDNHPARPNGSRPGKPAREVPPPNLTEDRFSSGQESILRVVTISDKLTSCFGRLKILRNAPPAVIRYSIVFYQPVSSIDLCRVTR